MKERDEDERAARVSYIGLLLSPRLGFSVNNNVLLSELPA